MSLFDLKKQPEEDKNGLMPYAKRQPEFDRERVRLHMMILHPCQVSHDQILQ